MNTNSPRMPRVVLASGSISRRRILQTALAGGAGIAAVSLLGACSQRENGATGAAGAPQQGGTIIWGKSQDFPDLDPHATSRAVAWQHEYLVYQQLVTLDDEMKVVPLLAESFEQPSPTQYVFNMRPDAKFSNGRTVTATDAKLSMERFLGLKRAGAQQFQGIDTIQAVDDRTLVVDFSEPCNTFLGALTCVYGAVMPMEEINAGQIDPEKEMVGSGPFVVESHRLDDRWVFRRNEHAWNAPEADGLEIRILPDDATRVAGLRDGSLHIALFDNPDAPQLIEGVSGVETVVQDNTDMYHLYLQALEAPFDDRRVRQAVAYAINRERIRDVALNGLGMPTSYSSATFGVVDTSLLPSFTRDVERSKRLLAEAGQTDLTFEIIHYNEVAAARVAQVLQQDLAEAGITVNVSSMDLGVWSSRTTGDNAGSFQGSESWRVAFGDPGMVMRFLPSTSTSVEAFTAPDPELDAALAAANSQADLAQRPAALQRAAELQDAHANHIPLVTRTSIIGYRGDKIQARFPVRDGNQDILRYVADFSVLG